MEVAIPVIVALLSAFVGAFVNSRSNRETNETNNEIAAQNNQTQIELQQMMNEYNSPVNQLARLREAGYSQSIGLTGNGLVDAGNQKTLPQLSAATMQPYQMDISGFQNAASIMSQARLQDAQAQNLDADTAKKLSELPNAAKEREKIDADIREINQRIKESEANVNLIKSTEGRLAVQNMNDVLTTLSSYSEALSRIDLNRSNKEYVDKQLSTYEIELRKKLSFLDASIAQAKASEKFINEQADQIKQLVKSGNAEFAAKYGNTDAEIKQALRMQYDAALNYYQKSVKDARLRNTLQPVLFWSELITEALDPVSSFVRKTAGVIK